MDTARSRVIWAHLLPQLLSACLGKVHIVEDLHQGISASHAANCNGASCLLAAGAYTALPTILMSNASLLAASCGQHTEMMEAQPACLDRSLHTCKFDSHSFGLCLDRGSRDETADRPVHELAAGKLDWEGG